MLARKDGLDIRPITVTPRKALVDDEIFGGARS
jgi:hypothetical protein